MARIRSIHAEQFTDDQWVTCSPLARLLAIGIRNQADDNGVFEWTPIKLKMRILPADNCDVADLLGELLETEQVMRYVVDGKAYGLIRSFHRYQKPKKPTYYHPTPLHQLPTGYAIKQVVSPASGEPVGNQWGNPPADGEGNGEGEGIKACTTSPPTNENDAPLTLPNINPQGDLLPGDIPHGERQSLPIEGGDWMLPDDYAAELATAYPVEYLRIQFRKMRIWLLSNPNKKPTSRGVKRFINGWMARDNPNNGGNSYGDNRGGFSGPISAIDRVRAANRAAEEREREQGRIIDGTATVG